MSGAIDPTEELGRKKSASPASAEAITGSAYYQQMQAQIRAKSGVDGPAPGSLEAAHAPGGPAAGPGGPAGGPAATPAVLAPQDGAAVSGAGAARATFDPAAAAGLFSTPAPAPGAAAAPPSAQPAPPEAVAVQQAAAAPAHSVATPAADAHVAGVQTHALRAQAAGPAPKAGASPAPQAVRINEVTATAGDNYELNVAGGEGSLLTADRVSTVTGNQESSFEDGDSNSGGGGQQQQGQ